MADQFLISLVSLCIAAAGNLINDLADLRMDWANRNPVNVIITQNVSIRKAITVYQWLLILSLLIALILCMRSSFFWMFWICPLSIALLHFYSSHLKCRPWTGNVVVAFFTSAVLMPSVIYFHEELQQLHTKELHFIQNYLFQLAVFAFGVNLIREWVKTIQDDYGDALCSCRTASVVFGKKMVAILISLGFISLITYSVILLYQLADSRLPYFMLLFIILPLSALLLYQLRIFTRYRRYRNLSAMLKLLMLSGLSYYIFAAYVVLQYQS